jgi:hypothetical protein
LYQTTVFLFHYCSKFYKVSPLLLVREEDAENVFTARKPASRRPKHCAGFSCARAGERLIIPRGQGFVSGRPRTVVPKGIFVSDIFHEVEEEVRRERLENIWKNYGDYIVAAACLLVIAAAGYQLWRVYDQRERAKASEAYSQAEQLYESGQIDLAAQSFAHIATTAPGGYADVARLQEANAMLASGKRDDAMALYKKIAVGSDPLLAQVALIHEGWGMVDSASRSDLETLLAPLTDPNSAWRFTAREILAYWDYRNGQTAKAAQEYASIAADPNAATQLHARALAMSVFLKAGGDNDYGRVPQMPEDIAQAAATGALPKIAPQTSATAQGPQKK